MSQSLERIIVGPNKRFLMAESGEPFFWLGDTAWELFHRVNRQDADVYLDVRSRQGYTVIQAVALAEVDGLRTPNANGHVPLCGEDPTRPNEFYFRHVDEIIRLAAAKGLYIGFLPTWGDKVNGNLWGAGPVIFTVENAYVYGKFLGQRYRDETNLIWILGGDRPATGYESIWAAMARGIIDGLGRRPLFTYHPAGGHSSSAWLQEADWLDMNMLQSGHVLYDSPNWEMVTKDYGLSPIRPVLDGEPNYEDHPIDPWTRKWTPSCGRYTDYDVRKQAYRAVFAGACGHTYGHHSIWQFWALDRQPINYPMPTWDEAIYRPGAAQLIHLKNLILSRPYLCRMPDQSMLPHEPVPPPAGHPSDDRLNPLRANHPRATRCCEGSFAFIYLPRSGQTVEVDAGKLSGKVRAWWFDPRNGKAHIIGEYPNTDLLQFNSPVAGPDWVLVLDVAEKGFDIPGK
jgi:hypothetical protein